MKRILLVRHGETVWHAENRYAGRTDIALTPLGESQAQQLALWAASANLNSVWSSSLIRAKQTATAAAIAANLPLQIDPRLVELDFGRGEGLTSAEMKLQFPRERAAFEQDPATNFLPGGEDPMQATDRGMSALASIADSLPEGGRALVVAHNTLLRLLVCRTLGLPLSRYRATFPELDNVTGTELGFSHGHVSLLSFNAPLYPLEKRV